MLSRTRNLNESGLLSIIKSRTIVPFTGTGEPLTLVTCEYKALLLILEVKFRFNMSVKSTHDTSAPVSTKAIISLSDMVSRILLQFVMVFSCGTVFLAVVSLSVVHLVLGPTRAYPYC